MKRFAAAVGIVVGLTTVVVLVSFTASKYRVEDQSYFRSLSDFWFMIGTYNAQALNFDPTPLTERSYERVMSHTRSTSHYEVDERVVWSLVRWGEAVAPRLVSEIEKGESRARAFAAAKALAELRYMPALPVLEQALRLARGDRRREVDLIEALGEFGPEAAPMLIDAYEWHRGSELGQPYNLLEAIGKAGGHRGVAFLLAEMEIAERADETERIHHLQWPLAYTRDPRAARKLVSLLHHPVMDIRRRSIDSMSQSMGPAAIEPVVDLLEHETDDYIRIWAIGAILASRDAAGSRRAVELLRGLLDDYVLADRAHYALARIGDERAVEVLRQWSAGKPASLVMEDLEYLSADDALGILEPYLDEEDPYERWAAIGKLEEMGNVNAVPLLEKRLDDPDPHVRRDAETVLRGMDLLLLEDSFLDWLAEQTGRRMGRIQRRRTEVVLGALSWVHWLGLGLSVLVGLYLLSGSLRAFEPFKFALVIQFLLVEGIVGDLFLMNSSAELYRWATAGRLVLLLGLLFLRDDPLPGETRGRVDRLVVRSLWVLVPLIVLLGAPVFANALRISLRDFDFMKWALLLLAVITVFILEQAFIPWHVLTRGSRIERGMTFLLSAAVTSLFAGALWRWVTLWESGSNRRLTSLNPSWMDTSVFGALLFAPLLVALVFHLKETRLFARRRAPLRRLSNPPGRIRVVDDGESLLIRLRRKRRVRGLPLFAFGASFLGIVWWMHTSLDVVSGGGPAMFMMIVLAVLGTAMGSLVFSGFSGLTVQVTDGAVRSASTFLGGATGATPWHRSLRVPAFLSQFGFTSAEKRWLSRILGGAKRPVPEVKLSLEVGQDRGEEGGIPLELRVQNAGAEPVRLADVEAAHRSRWTAHMNGTQGDVYFSRAEREAVIEPGHTRTFRPRLYGYPGGGSIELRCGLGGPVVQCP